MSVIFSGNYVKENKSIYPTKSAVNIYIASKLDTIKSTRNTDFTIQNALFGAVKMLCSDPSDSDHNKYNGYGIAFDEGSDFSFGNIVNGKNMIILVLTCLLVHMKEIDKMKFLCWEKMLSKE